MVSSVPERKMGGVIALSEKGVEADGWVDLALVDAGDERHKPLRQTSRLVLPLNGTGINEFFYRFKIIWAEVDAAWEGGYAEGGVPGALSRAKAVIGRYQRQFPV